MLADNVTYDNSPSPGGMKPGLLCDGTENIATAHRVGSPVDNNKL
jgi:hypothetical protein